MKSAITVLALIVTLFSSVASAASFGGYSSFGMDSGMTMNGNGSMSTKITLTANIPAATNFDDESFDTAFDMATEFDNGNGSEFTCTMVRNNGFKSKSDFEYSVRDLNVSCVRD